ncbi:MAG: relaxase/mobilization nuclease domain-containing protein [Lachnospiraceae bacterium]|nr:relaxase/mobilization nuclease domain-containing protein [Lachnospiraceae bacterium]
MTAICKTIAIHGSNLSHLLDYGANQEKTSVSMNGLSNVLEYAADPLKTIAQLDDGDKDLLVSGVLCKPETALVEFGIVRESYLSSHGGERYASFDYADKMTGTTRMIQKEPVTAIHLIQSFAETDLDCHTVHQAGIELCERLGVQAVVDTHMNKEHLHNHIIINAYMPDGVSKFCLTADKRMQIRELSDEIQHEYGIELKLADPRSQLTKSHGHHNYREWDAKRQNISWKEEMKQDIAAARSVSDSREDFITIMEDYGYEIARQEASSITWWNKTHTRKIRDRTLGTAYELGTLFAENTHQPEYIVRREPDPERKRPKTISIARYDWDGRRRSDLELLIRKAILLIRHAGSRYQAKSLSSTHTTTRKLELMEQALSTVQNMNLKDKEAFSKKLDMTGARLSHVKSQLDKLSGQKAYYDIIAPMRSSYASTRQMADSVHYWPDGSMPDLMLQTPSSEEIQKAKAALCPMSASQKRDLYLTLQKHPEYTLTGDVFSGISAMDAEEIFAFFQGTRTDQPSVLKRSVDITMERTYQKRNEFLKQKFDRPIQKYQMEEITALLSAHGTAVSEADLSALTQFDVINIRNCYGCNPFLEPPIGADAIHYLSQKLSDQGLVLNRDIRYVLPSEYRKLLDYMDGFTKTVPGLLKSSPPVSPPDADKLQTFMDAKGITSSIPVSAMSKTDFERMYGFVLSQGHTPDCVKSTIPKPDRTEEFVKSIQIDGITEKKQLLLLQLRNQTNELLSLGIDPNNIAELSKCISDFRQSYQSLEHERAQLASEYKSLLALKQQLTYAESPSFLFGSLFDEKVHQTPEVIEKDEKDAQDRSDGKGTKDPTGKDSPREKPPAGNGRKINIDMDVDL